MRHAIEKGTIKREDIFLATKISDENNAGYEGTRNLVAKQLKFFQTDYIDLYMLHSPMQAKLQAETWRAMEEVTSIVFHSAKMQLIYFDRLLFVF